MLPSGSLNALRILARGASCLRVPRSVWTASGLPALSHRPRPLLSLQKARASSTHSKRWRDVPSGSDFFEASGPACRRFHIARDHWCPSKKREQAPRTPNAGARFVSPGQNESLLRFAPVAGHFESQFKNTFIPLVHFTPKSRFMSGTITNQKPKETMKVSEQHLQSTQVRHRKHATTWSKILVLSGAVCLVPLTSLPIAATAGQRPITDFTQLIVCPEPGQELEVVSIRAQASGPLRVAFGVPEGTPGRLEVSQTGLIATAAKANANSRVAYDAFPAEHIIIRAVGK